MKGWKRWLAASLLAVAAIVVAVAPSTAADAAGCKQYTIPISGGVVWASGTANVPISSGGSATVYRTGLMYAGDSTSSCTNVYIQHMYFIDDPSDTESWEFGVQVYLGGNNWNAVQSFYSVPHNSPTDSIVYLRMIKSTGFRVVALAAGIGGGPASGSDIHIVVHC